MRGRITIILFLFFFILIEKPFAQPEIKVEHYSRKDGLPSNAISDILLDSRGYMWFSTWEGLSRFDGFDFVNYKTGADSNIPYLHNRISRIHEDKSGNIWMMMYDGKFFRLNRKTDKFESLIGSFPNSINARIEGPLFASDGTVWAIIQDTGALEIETDSLSNRMAVRFHPLADIKINQLYEDSFSTIWAATSGGARVMKSDILAIKQHEENEEALVTTQLDSCIYWGTANGNLIKYDYTNRLLIQNTIKAGEKILSITSNDKESALYIGTQQSGLFRYNVHSGRIKQIIPELLNVNYLYTDSEGLIWMYTNQPGVGMYNPQSSKYTTFKQKVSIPEEYNPAGTIDEHSGTIWVRMNKGGFGYYNRETNKIDYFHNNPDIPNSLSNVVSVAEISSPDMVWISTYTRGVDKLSIINKKTERVLLKKSASSMLDNEIRALFLDKDSVLWMSTKSGVIYGFDKQMNVTHRITHDEKGNNIGRVYAITQDYNGDLWLGTRGNGLFKMSKNKQDELRFEHYIHNPTDSFSISANAIFNILVDSKGRIWVATYGGGVNLVEQKNGKISFLSANNYFKEYKTMSSLHKVRTLLEDKEGQIWAGTTEGLMSISYDEAKKDICSTVYRKEENSTTSLSGNDILCGYKDSNGNLWFGTIGGGLNKYVGKSSSGKANFISYMVKDRLPSNEIRSITEDRDANLWFTTENNICSFNPTTGIFSKLSVLEGVDNTMFSESAAAVTSNGNIVFGTINGYYLIDKQKLSGTGNSGFKLQITDFQINEENTSPRLNASFEEYIPESGFVTLPNRHAVFSIRFASLNYPLQHRIHYQYMLEGVDESWKDGDLDRKATYVNVPAGNYLFKIKAFLPERPDVYELKSLQIEVPLYSWESQKAYVLYICLLILLCVGFWGFQYRRRRRMLNQLRVLKIGPSEIAFRDDDDYKFISALLEWLENNYTNPDLRIEDMVASSGLGRTTFYNRLKALVQMSPIEFVSDFRMKKAKMYIEKTNSTIAEIAYRTGFSDPVYFTRLFKAKYNETPSQCRKKSSLNQMESQP
ncbi:helix-turn-helix domain-containing protein [Bacteroides sp. 214]|uniref:AraC family transcriptional regulator n=1 Tax=Bacteroides sp. 214 TaxID=2302935 RepID=UPI0013D47DFC|nr:two-component regulator propeller domain-containing protein [Bacteroides sp. 214]NDW13631.1 helix-turn-helix domain-containing protein [Bacteroides sp. 214]